MSVYVAQLSLGNQLTSGGACAWPVHDSCRVDLSGSHTYNDLLTYLLYSGSIFIEALSAISQRPLGSFTILEHCDHTRGKPQTHGRFRGRLRTQLVAKIEEVYLTADLTPFGYSVAMQSAKEVGAGPSLKGYRPVV